MTTSLNMAENIRDVLWNGSHHPQPSEILKKQKGRTMSLSAASLVAFVILSYLSIKNRRNAVRPSTSSLRPFANGHGTDARGRQ